MSTKKDLAERPVNGSGLVWLEQKIMGVLRKLYVTKKEFTDELAEKLEGVTGGTVSAGVYQYKGQVDDYASLPTDEMSDETIGWTYDAKDTGMNWAWNGEGWDNLGAIFEFNPLTTDELEILFATPGLAVAETAGAFTLGDLLNSGDLVLTTAEDGTVTVGGDAQVKAVEATEGEPRIFAVPIAFGVDTTEDVTVTISAENCNPAYASATYADSYTVPAAEVVKGILVPLGMKNPESSANKDVEFTEVTVTLSYGEDTTETYTVVKGDDVTLFAFKSWTTSGM